MDYDIQTLSPEPSSFSMHVCVSVCWEGERGREGVEVKDDCNYHNKKNHFKKQTLYTFQY